MPFIRLKSEYFTKADNNRRLLVEKAQDRLHLLRAEEFKILGPYLLHGMPLAALSRLLNMERRRLARRLEQLLRGLVDDRYISLRRYDEVIAPRSLEIGYERFIRGDSYQAIARRHHLSGWQVRRICEKLEAFIDAKSHGKNKTAKWQVKK